MSGRVQADEDADDVAKRRAKIAHILAVAALRALRKQPSIVDERRSAENASIAAS